MKYRNRLSLCLSVCLSVSLSLTHTRTHHTHTHIHSHYISGTFAWIVLTVTEHVTIHFNRESKSSVSWTTVIMHAIQNCSFSFVIGTTNQTCPNPIFFFYYTVKHRNPSYVSLFLLFPHRSVEYGQQGDKRSIFYLFFVFKKRNLQWKLVKKQFTFWNT